MDRRSVSAARGNVFFVILLGIALFAALSMALVQMDRGGKDTSSEKAKIIASRVLAYAREVRIATQRLHANGVSEADIRFAYPSLATDYGDISVNPTNQVFSDTGGGLPYAPPPDGASNNTSPVWAFFGNSNIPQVGTAEADLTIVLPNVNASVCQEINVLVGYAATDAIPADSGSDCVYSSTATDVFAGTFKSGGSINAMSTTGFTVLPAMQACVSCSGTYHFYSVLLER